MYVQSWALVVIDETPLRKQLLHEYHKKEKNVESARVQLETFEQGDKPAYERWDASCFGALLTEIRNLTGLLQQKNAILNEVEDEYYFAGCSRAEAYRRVTSPPEEMPPGEDPSQNKYDEDSGEDADPFFGSYGESGKNKGPALKPPPGFNAEEYDAMSDFDKRSFREDYAKIAQMSHLLMGTRLQPFEEWLDDLRNKGTGRRANKPKGKIPAHDTASQRPVDRRSELLKEIYRSLVRALHPDHRKAELTPREYELWLQVQNAYHRKDLEALEALSGRVHISITKQANNLPLSVIRRMRKDMEAALKGLKKQLTTARKHPAWKFAQKATDLAPLEKKRHFALQCELAYLKSAFEKAEREIAALAAKAAKIEEKKRRPKKAEAAKVKPPKPIPDLGPDLFESHRRT